MKKSKIDIPVALIFFNRPEQFAIVFEEVKKARPAKLFLIQDGPRQNNPNDVSNIQKCREILKGIDWECDVQADFSEENLGCGRRIFTGLSKCFEQVDRLIILEDDCVPSQSFFPFCEEVLERYKDDERVGLISGMNHLNSFDCGKADYFFASVGSIAGWATWRRSWKDVTFELDKIVADDDAMRLLKGYEKYAPHKNRVHSNAKEKYEQILRGEKLSSWSTQFGLNQILNSRLIVVPRVNLMTNIGLSAESANSPSSIKFIPRGLRPLYQLKLFEMAFPLKHPDYMMSDIEYGRNVDKLMNPGRLIGVCRKMESILRRLLFGEAKGVLKGIKRRIRQIARKFSKK